MSPRTRTKLRDVANAAGVSVSVASRALGGYRDVAPGTRERIQRAAATLGYRASVRARSLVSGKDAPLRCAIAALGVSPGELGQHFLGPVLAGLLAEAGAHGVEVQLITTDRAELPADALRRLAAEDRADGFVIMTGLPLTPEDVLPLEDARVPFVLTNRHFGERAVNCVTYDWEEATHDAVRRLHALGHRRMALLLPNLQNTTVRGHEVGWLAGARALGLEPVHAPVIPYMPGKDSDEDNGREQTRRLLHDGLPDCGDSPTGIVGFNDWCALGALHGAALEGVRVPEDISVIGFDNTLLGVASSPRMCSYQPKSLQMGSEAMRLLATLIEGVQEAPRRVSVPVDYVSRESVGPAPESLAGASQSLRVLVNSA